MGVLIQSLRFGPAQSLAFERAVENSNSQLKQ